MRLLWCCALIVGLPMLPAAQRPTFEVTSVKSNNTVTNPNRWRVGAESGPAGCCARFVATNATLTMLITYAYPDLLVSEIVGGPGWIDTLRFDVEGRPDARNVPVPLSQLQLMLRALLEDRFGLRTHIDRRDAAVYHVVLANDRPVLKVSSRPLEEKTGRLSAEAAGIIAEGTAAPISLLVTSIQPYTTRRILDRTGLTAVYDYQLKFSPETTAATATTDGSFPVIFTALQEQLGLKLERATGQVEVLVIDSVRIPEEN